MTGKGTLVGRVWLNPQTARPLRIIRVFGERFELHFPSRLQGSRPEAFHRQTLAFGAALNEDISALRIGVVGNGATGSATCMLLGRLGAQWFAVFDADVAEITNLSRLHGAVRSDIDNGAAKVAIQKRHIEGFGLGACVVTFDRWVGDAECRDALRACDVIFGCTDDDDGRLLLNRFAYFYLTPVIDMGIAIDPDLENGRKWLCPSLQLASTVCWRGGA